MKPRGTVGRLCAEVGMSRQNFYKARRQRRRAQRHEKIFPPVGGAKGSPRQKLKQEENNQKSYNRKSGRDTTPSPDASLFCLIPKRHRRFALARIAFANEGLTLDAFTFSVRRT